MLSEEDNYILGRTLHVLLQDFEPREAVLFMASKSIFTTYQQDSVLNKHGRTSQIYEFIKQYRRSAQNLNDLAIYFTFYGQIHIARLLADRSVLKDLSYVKNELALELLKFSNIPGPVPNHIYRADLVDKLRNDLLEMRNLDSFLYIVHGPAGCGKTCLVADTLRCSPDLIQSYTQVIWLHDGKVSSSQLPALYTDFYVFASDSVELVNCSCPLMFNSQQQVRNVLRSRKNLLVILDDVVLEECLRWFDDLNCRIVATTRNSELLQVSSRTKKLLTLYNFSSDEFKSYALSFKKEIPLELISDVYAVIDGHPVMACTVMNICGDDPKKLEWFCENFGKEKYPLRIFDYVSPYRYRNMHDALMRTYQRLNQLERDVLTRMLAFEPGFWINSTAISPLVPIDYVDDGSDFGHYTVLQVLKKLTKLSLIIERRENFIEQYRLHLLVLLLLLDMKEYEELTARDFSSANSILNTRLVELNMDSVNSERCMAAIRERWTCMSKKIIANKDKRVQSKRSRPKRTWGEICILM